MFRRQHVVNIGMPRAEPTLGERVMANKVEARVGVDQIVMKSERFEWRPRRATASSKATTQKSRLRESVWLHGVDMPQ